MAETLDVESDPFLTLLTDALRAGPTSPEWHQAVARLRAGDVASADDYQLLITARGHLESGRQYREVKPGPGFTRKVFAQVDAEPSGGGSTGGLPMANLVAMGSAVLVLILLGLIGFWILHGGQRPAEDVSNVYLGTTLSSVDFLPGPEGIAPTAVTGSEDSLAVQGWLPIGNLRWYLSRKGAGPNLPVGTNHNNSTKNDTFQGGGLRYEGSLPTDTPFALEATFRLSSPNDNVIPQLFVTDNPDFSADRATSPRELVWVLRGRQARVVTADNQFAGETGTIDASGMVTARLIVGRESAVVVSSGRTLWSGRHGLSDAPRYAGVRFLSNGNAKKDSIVIQSLKLLRK